MPVRKVYQSEVKAAKLQNLKGLKECVMCAVCQEVAKVPTFSRKCLHMFCKACIEDYNRR